MSRRPKYRTRKLPKQSRTIPMQDGNPEVGFGKDIGKLYRCWNCGFPCRTDRDALGGERSVSGATQETYYAVSDPGVENRSVLDATELEAISLQLGADGNPIEISHPMKAEVSGGCPLCGTKNWRGDY